MVSNAELRRKLRDWRTRKTIQEGLVEEYRVFPNAAIESIVELRPKNPVELLKCSQIGSARAKKYGAEVLALIREAEGLPEAQDDELLTQALPTANANHKQPWTAIQEDGIMEMLEEGQSLKVMAAVLGRTEGEVRQKIKRMGLEPPAPATRTAAAARRKRPATPAAAAPAATTTASAPTPNTQTAAAAAADDAVLPAAPATPVSKRARGAKKGGPGTASAAAALTPVAVETTGGAGGAQGAGQAPVLQLQLPLLPGGLQHPLLQQLLATPGVQLMPPGAAGSR